MYHILILPPRFYSSQWLQNQNQPHTILKLFPQKFSRSYLSFAKKLVENKTDTSILSVTNLQNMSSKRKIN